MPDIVPPTVLKGVDCVIAGPDGGKMPEDGFKPPIVAAGAFVSGKTLVPFHILEEVSSFGIPSVIVLFHPVVELHFIVPFRDDRTEIPFTRVYM